MDLSPHQPLRDSLAFWLLRTANAVRLHHGDVLAGTGVTFNQYLTLRAIREHGRTHPSKVARTLGVHASDVTRIARRLETRFLVLRTATAADRRAVVLRLSRKGEDVLDQVEQGMAEADRKVLEGLGPHAADHLRDWLQAVLIRSDRRDPDGA